MRAVPWVRFQGPLLWTAHSLAPRPTALLLSLLPIGWIFLLNPREAPPCLQLRFWLCVLYGRPVFWSLRLDSQSTLSITDWMEGKGRNPNFLRVTRVRVRSVLCRNPPVSSNRLSFSGDPALWNPGAEESHGLARLLRRPLPGPLAGAEPRGGGGAAPGFHQQRLALRAERRQAGAHLSSWLALAAQRESRGPEGS